MKEGLPLTPDIVRAAYEYLRATPPFKRWGLPHADEIKVRITRHRDRQGHARWDGKQFEIAVSQMKIGRTHTLIELVAHEMVHVRCHMQGDTRAEHSKVWHRYADSVCRYHGFDRKTF